MNEFACLAWDQQKQNAPTRKSKSSNQATGRRVVISTWLNLRLHFSAANLTQETDQLVEEQQNSEMAKY